MILTIVALLIALQAYFIIQILHTNQDRRRMIQNNFVARLSRKAKYQNLL